MGFRRAPPPPQCPFCEAPLTDMMLGFLDHVDASPNCHWLWNEWRGNVKREAGGT